MFNLLSRILGSGDVISKGMELLDDAFESDIELLEAKTDSKIKTTTAASNAKVNLLKAYAPFKLAQRYLAIMFTGTYLVTFAVVMGYVLLGTGGKDAVIDVLNEFYIGEIIFMIVGFYFGGGAVEGIVGKIKK